MTEAAASPVGRPEIDGKPTPREALIWGFLVVFMLIMIGLSIWRRADAVAEPPGLYGAVPAFSLTNRDGTSVGNGDLAGAPWVADFMFTRCVGICPQLSNRMQRLVRTLGPNSPVRFASFSVDPVHDTPSVLEAYAQRFEAPDRWLFLTGAPDAMHTLVRAGFKLAVEPAGDTAPAGEDILHSNRFVLVDAAGIIRGYYDAFDPAAMDQLVADLKTL